MAARAKFKDGQLVWIKAKIKRHTCVGYTVKANGGDVAGYVATDKMKRRGRERKDKVKNYCRQGIS